MEEIKKEMEIEKPKLDKKMVIQIIFLVLILITICLLFYTAGTLVKYGDMIRNPVGENLAYWNISSCSYWTEQGMVTINATKSK
jgi:hypothetical protein